MDQEEIVKKAAEDIEDLVGGPEEVKVPSMAKKLVDEVSTTTPTPNFTIQNEITMWKDRIGLSTGRGLVANRLVNALMGFNHRIVNNPMPINREIQSLVFFVRPDLRLDNDNVANSRKLSDFVAQERASTEWSIISALSPLSPLTSLAGEKATLGTRCHSDIPFDNLQAFIPLLTSQIVNFSAPPDSTVDNWLSDEGIKREQWGMADSTNEINYGYNISTTFNNTVSDPIMRMMDLWLEWMAGVKMGKFKPWIENSIQRRIDYQSRAYVISFDPLGKIVRFANTGVMWPLNDNAGTMSAFDRMQGASQEDTTVSINWQCIGARYNDPMYMQAFNDTVATFNPDMIPLPNLDDYVPVGHNYLRKLEPHELPMFNYYGYPHINIVTRQLSWYVYQSDYEFILKRAGLL